MNSLSPTIFRHKNYRFFFFSREEEREHIHVISPEGEAKFWILPNITLAKSVGFSEKELKTLEKLIKEKEDEIISKWKQYFGR